MDEIEKMAAEIKTANPVRKMMLAQELLPMIVQKMRHHELHMKNSMIRLTNLEAEIAKS